eukprot:49953_1
MYHILSAANDMQSEPKLQNATNISLLTTKIPEWNFEWSNAAFEYANIKIEYNSKMFKLLQNKTKQDLFVECSLQDCSVTQKDLFTTCQSLRRIDCILDVYNKLLNCEKLWASVPFEPLICNDKYGYQQIHNDFLHVKMYHIDVDEQRITKQQYENRDATHENEHKQTIAEIMCCHFNSKYMCKNGFECISSTRHYRDRTDVQKGKQLFYIEQNDTKSQKMMQIKNDKDLVLQEQCDTIHFFFLLSIIQKNNRIYRGLRRARYSPVGRARGAYIDEKKQTEKVYFGTRDDEEWLAKFNCDDAKDDGYESLVRHMGIFRWQSAHGFREGQNQAVEHLKPIFANFKQEVLQNKFCPLSKANWNLMYRKSKVFYQSFARQNIKTTNPGNFKMSDSVEEWGKGEEIKLDEICKMKLYTDFDKLQYELKKSFRFENIVEMFHKLSVTYENKQLKFQKLDKYKKRELEKRLRHFYHWRIGLLIVLNKYGKKIDKNYMVLYHGINAKMIIHRPASPTFYGPLSTTPSYHVAKAFATTKGMVLTLTSLFPRIGLCNAFNASLISDYPEEQEYLIGQIYVRLLRVETSPIIDHITDVDPFLCVKTPLASKIREAFCSIHLFYDQTFSMSDNLEFYLIHFLKCSAMECCINSYGKMESLRFLSFLCCQVAHHPQALTKPNDWKMIDTKNVTMMKMLWKKFIQFKTRPKKQTVKIDQISQGLKHFFLEKRKSKTIVSFRRLLSVFPNVQKVHYINEYRCDNEVLTQLLDILKQGKHYLTKVLFLYFNYNDVKEHRGVPPNGNNFFHPTDLDTQLVKKLTDVYGWKIKYQIEKTGFKINFHSGDYFMNENIVPNLGNDNSDDDSDIYD